MRRIIFFAAALMLTLSVTAQNKMLSSKQLMTRGLYPQATMRGFQLPMCRTPCSTWAIPARPKSVSPSGR